MSNRSPIGIFDSGVGGTSIWKEIHSLLPFENTMYLADSKNAPYGYRSEEEIIELSIKNTKFLLNENCKIIVVACNTATTNAISVLRAKYNVPFIGIEPAIKPAALRSVHKSVGILATRGTLSSELFSKTSSKFASDIKVTEVVGEGLVPLIEAGKLDDPELTDLLQKYLTPMLEAEVDYIVLGCSHYPYLIPQIQKMIPDHVKIIDSGEAVARQTKSILEKAGLLNPDSRVPELRFYTNTETNTLESLLADYSEEIIIGKMEF